MTRNIIAKFGGTSVKTASAIRNVANIVAANPNIRIVVVSAVGGITNLLLEFCQAEKEQRMSLIDRIIQIHCDLVNELQLNLDVFILAAVQRLRKVYASTHLDHNLIDDIMSLGEDLSSIIVTAYLNAQGLAAGHLDARRFMLTDDHYGKATPQLSEIRAYKFPAGLSVTQGFIGSTRNGATTTLGRGGSDYSAALIAEAMDADELLIYTDVPGVYTMDPNQIPEANSISTLTFQEMAEMASFGAKILHPATLEPCVRAKVPIRILSTFEPEKAGTLITMDEGSVDKNACIRAITMRPGQVLVTIRSLKMLNAYGFLANIFNILARYKISVDLITTSEVTVALTIDETSLGSHSVNPFIENQELLKELHEFAEIIVEENLSLLAVIGYGLTAPGIVQTILKVLTPYKIRSVCYGASNSSVGILIPKDDADRMASLLHNYLLGGNHV